MHDKIYNMSNCIKWNVSSLSGNSKNAPQINCQYSWNDCYSESELESDTSNEVSLVFCRWAAFFFCRFLRPPSRSCAPCRYLTISCCISASVASLVAIFLLTASAKTTITQHFILKGKHINYYMVLVDDKSASYAIHQRFTLTPEAPSLLKFFKMWMEIIMYVTYDYSAQPTLRVYVRIYIHTDTRHAKPALGKNYKKLYRPGIEPGLSP